MKIAVLIIFYGGLVWGFWMAYELIKHYQGPKIKKYWGRYMALHEAGKLDKELREYRLLKQLENNRVIECPVEEVTWDEVGYYNERPERTPTVIVLEINANKLESPTQ